MASLKVNMETHVVIDGLPKVPAERKAMFEKLLTKKIGDLLGHTNFAVKLVEEDSGVVIGAFLDCHNVAAADRAVAKLNKFHLTKTDVFQVNRWSDFTDAEYTPDDYEPLEEDELERATTTELTNPMMSDRLGRPQIMVKAGDNFDINWSYLFPNTGKLEPVKPTHDLQPWAAEDRRAKKLQPGMPTPLPMWSPQGTFVITQEKGAIKLWGGKGTGLVCEFPAPEARYVQMSPCEKYLVIYGREFNFWDVGTSRLIATIPGEAPFWPVFKYNADDSLCATFSRERGTVLVFKADTMELQTEDLPPRFTIKEEGMCAFAWSPTNPNVFAYAVAGDENTGFRVQIDKITLFEDTEDSKNMCEVRQLCRRNYFGTAQLDLLWHPMGNFLAAKITKTTGQMAYGIFRVQQHSASAEALEVKGEPIRFAWQPNAGRFGIILSETKTAKQRICFHEMTKPGFKDVGTFPSGGVRLFWAPKGTRCVAVNYNTSRLEFYGVQGCGPFASDQKMTAIASVEHPMITDAEWDPTGRFLCSWVSSLKQQMDNAWMVWNVNGQKIFEQKIGKLSHCAWRPLAPSLLMPEDLQRLKAQLPAKSQKYKEEALAVQRKADEQTASKKKTLLEKYRNTMDAIWAHHEKKDYANIRAGLIAKSPSAKKQQKLLESEAAVKEEQEVYE
eukprot:CAMPEP_0174829506 /NCGR_PEP_ID=MMETSP1114-20130205/1955_1 /TAXON_ID=312471 /ORGANISM="Neobodo designis, Strain CCAP 1951/1" /LENGTH=669 /DNA_ID=CAMNT_0016063255 /DNA_START=113 /DNA_END=2122 /DNA_ORIENTATION=+